ncbi:membrane-anchored junction protein [Colius striatus]|uniref:membrane-anchored junction protein n=1 Tax=Colius striatus TaxID=57412 RepID=UPI002B1DACFF|nr:membrane-anchored junction protein [Colius striatus]
MPLRAFTCPLPETRFLRAGKLLYKCRIRYGNFSSAPGLDNAESTARELEEAIRVILGNLDDLHPFSTEHFTIFPYLSKWERVSKLRFKHKNVQLVPYPYVCTMYVELNSFQQNLSRGKSLNVCHVLKVKRRNEGSESTAGKEVVKRRRVEVRAETSCPQLGRARTGAECVQPVSKAKHGFQTVSYRTFRKSKQHLFSHGFLSGKHENATRSPAKRMSLSLVQLPLLWAVAKRVSVREPVGSNTEQGTAAGQSEGAKQLPQQTERVVNKGAVESEGRSVSSFWRSVILRPLQNLLGGKN